MPSLLCSRKPFRGNRVTAILKPNGTYEVYSYDTLMLKVTKGGTLYFNSRKYSVTTSRLQNILRSVFDTERARKLS